MDFYQCLPPWLGDILQKQRDLREIRLRDDVPVKVDLGGQWWWCNRNGLTKNFTEAMPLDLTCQQIVASVCNNSIYAYEKMLASGFFTLADGSRFGVAGERSFDDKVFKTYTSICVRIPHCVSCATCQMVDYATNGSLLIVGAPSSGKTTLLRDLARNLSMSKNVVVVDERGELAVRQQLDNCDVIKWASKGVALQMAVRSLAPYCIFCDELSATDIPFVERALSSGVKVVTTLHAQSLGDVQAVLGNLYCKFTNVILCKSVGEYEVLKVCD